MDQNAATTSCRPRGRAVGHVLTTDGPSRSSPTQERELIRDDQGRLTGELEEQGLIASFQSRNGWSRGSRVYRTSASAKSRSDSPSVASVAAKYRPPVAWPSACSR
jgi:hypothetical protein